MSSPTPGSDPNYPQGGAPQGQPDWGAPQPPAQSPEQGYGGPAPSYSGAPAGYGAAGQRPGMVTAAAVIAIVWGGLGALWSFIIMLAAFGLGAAVGGLIFLLYLAFSVALLLGGIFVLQGKPPKLLLYMSYVGLGLGLLSFITSLVATGGNAATGILGLIVCGVIVALLLQPQSKQYFATRGQSY
jgi:hypothetical protein